MDESSDDDFKDTFESYFHKESVLKYYLFCLCFASVDTLAKNLHFVRYRDLWYILPYDCDSVLGGSNVGFLNISSSCEVGNVYDEQDPTLIVEPNQFNSWNGRLWERLRNTFGVDLTSMWTTLRSNGIFNYDNFIKYFDQIWDVLPPTMYNSSQQIKYIDYGVTGQVALHGNRKHQIKKFLRERLAYLDSKFGFYSDGGAENYVNIRMNTLGNVSLTVETYYPVYYTVKWATNNIETHRIAKNTKCTFKYFSDVSTDREVLLYLPHALKSIENLDSLKPASIDISKAVKLNKIEVHSDRLFSVNLANNKYLRTIDFNGCVKLGTDTISTMSIIYAKYLEYLDVRGTKLTAINFPNEGGSIVECYLPETITSLEVKNQLLLTDLILQDNTVDLATVDISNCPNISRLSEISTDKQFDVFKYCRNLKINNSFLSTKEIELSGFTRLQNITLSNIEGLESLGLNDLCEVGGTSSLRYIGVSNCKNLTTLTMNCSSNNYEITFANNALLDLSTANVVEIFSNCIIKGLDTIVLPRTIKNMFFTDDYGSGYSSVVNMWSAQTAAIDSTGVFPEARHMDANSGSIDSYKGIDFFGLQFQNIDLAALVNIPNAKNFNLSPTTVNPNFNKNRDGETYPYLRPSGILDLSNYTESLANFFNGVDLDEFIVICNNPLPQTDLSYCFFNATFSTDSAIEAILSNTTGVTNLDYCFYKTNVADTSILNKVNTAAGCTMNYTFAECPNIKTLINIVIPSNVTEVEGMFNKCPLTSITNMTINVAGSISGLFKGCDQLITIATLRIPNVTDVSSTFDGCTNLTNLTGFSLPGTCTKVDNLFNGCYALSVLSMSFGPNIVSGENWYPPNLTTLNDTEILNSAVKLKDCTTLTDVNNMYIEKGDFNDLFNGCVKLTNLDIILGSEIGSMARMLKNCRKINTLPFTIPSTCTNIDEIFVGTAITDVSGLTFDTRITSATNWYSSSITKANNVTIKNSYVKLNIPTLTECDGLLLYNMNNLDNFLENTAIPRLTGLTIPNTVRSMKCFLKNNTAITVAEIKMPNDVTNISELISGCSLLRDISGTTFASGITNATDWNLGVPLTTLNNITLNTGLVKFTGINTVKYVENFVIGDNVTNIDELFKNCYNLTSDIYIPLHVISCISAFQNCRGLTHAHSNWDDTYTNGITATGCYSGCTEITHIDGVDIGKSAYVNGLDSIPPAWGGYGMYPEYTTIAEFEVDEADLTLVITGNTSLLTDDKIIDWGDGTVTYGADRHTYAKAGVYVVKGKYWFANVNLTWRKYITKLIKGTQQPVSVYNCFASQSWSKMTYADFSDMTLTDVQGMCGGSNSANAINFETIIFKNTTFNTNNLNSFIKGCLIENLDLSGIKFTKPITTLQNAFLSCSNLKKLDLSAWDLRYITTMNSLCNGCTALEEVVFPETHLVTCAEGSSKRLDIRYAFENAKSLKKLDLSMMYGQAEDVWHFLSGANSIKEFYVQNLTATPNHLGYSFPGTSLTEFRYFKSVTWLNPNSTNVFQNFTLASYKSLSKESLLSFLNALPDITSLTSTVYTLPIGSANMAKLTEDEILTFTNKGYSLTV